MSRTTGLRSPAASRGRPKTLARAKSPWTVDSHVRGRLLDYRAPARRWVAGTRDRRALRAVPRDAGALRALRRLRHGARGVRRIRPGGSHVPHLVQRRVPAPEVRARPRAPALRRLRPRRLDRNAAIPDPAPDPPGRGQRGRRLIPLVKISLHANNGQGHPLPCLWDSPIKSHRVGLMRTSKVFAGRAVNGGDPVRITGKFAVLLSACAVSAAFFPQSTTPGETPGQAANGGAGSSVPAAVAVGMTAVGSVAADEGGSKLMRASHH